MANKFNGLQEIQAGSRLGAGSHLGAGSQQTSPANPKEVSLPLAGFYSAADDTMPPLQWPGLSPPCTSDVVPSIRRQYLDLMSWKGTMKQPGLDGRHRDEDGEDSPKAERYS